MYICLTLIIVWIQSNICLIYVDFGISNGNGSINLPFSSLDTALEIYQNDDIEFFLLSSQNITKNYDFTSNITFLSNDANITTINFFEPVTILKCLKLVNLTIEANIQKFSLFIIKSFGTLNIINCQINNLIGTENFKNFLFVSSFANITMINSLIFAINNTNLSSFIEGNLYSIIIIMNCNFYDISIENTQLIVSNTSLIFFNSSNFKNMYSFKGQKNLENQAFLNLFNSKFEFILSNIFNSTFYSFPFLSIFQVKDDTIDNSFYITDIIGCQFSNIISSYLSFYDYFISISSVLLSTTIFQYVFFLEMTTDNSIISIFNALASNLLNMTFFQTTSNRDIYIKDTILSQIINCTFYTNNLNIMTSNLESTVIFLENVQNKIIDTVTIANCSSSWTTPGIKIISQISPSSTQINNSLFSNNRIFYPSEYEAGASLYIQSNEENIIIKNSLFDSNLVLPTQMIDRVGGSCARVFGTNLNMSLYNSIFRNNQAVFGCNCIEFDGIELNINNSLFLNNTNFLPVVNKDVVESIGNGGSIYSIGQNLNINNSQFIQNMNYFGGNIYLNGNNQRNEMNFNIDNTNFINNYAHTFGAVIYVAEKVINMRAYLTNSLLLLNWGNYNSAIFLNYNSVNAIFYCFYDKFILNWSDFSTVIDYEITAGISYIQNCVFLNNTASWFPRDPDKYIKTSPDDYGCGGAIGINAKSGSSETYIYSENNTYSFNKATVKGSSVITIGGNFSDKNSIFSYNRAGTVGTFYVHVSSYLSLFNSTVIESFAYDQSCISLREFSYFLITNSVFKNIIATEGKGLIYINNLSEMMVVNSTFENISSKYGSIFYITNNRKSQVYFKNNTFINNFNFFGEEMFYSSNSFNIVFEENSIINCSNRIFDFIDSTFTFRNNTIKSVSCLNLIQDGCIFYLTQNSIINIENYIISQITTVADAALIFSSNSFININNSDIHSIYSYMNQSFMGKLSFTKLVIFQSSFENFNLGGFHLINSSYFLLNGSMFSKNDNSNNIESSILFLEDVSFISIKLTNFFNNYNAQNGSAINMKCTNFNNISNFIIEIDSSNFVTNIVQSNGGAIYIFNCPININSSTFYNNSADNMGGSIHYEGPYALNLYNNNFLKNKANQGGAIKYTEAIPNIYTNNKFSQNYASYGQNIASYPIRFNIAEILSGLNLNNYSLEGRPTTLEGIIQNFSLSLLDSMNQTVSTLNDQFVTVSLIDLSTNKLISMSGDIKITIIQGKINFENVYFYSNITKDAALFTINTLAIPAYPYFSAFTKNEKIKNNQYNLQIPLTILPCLIGEVFDTNLLTCIQCSNGKYSFSLSSTACKICPMEASKCSGDNIFLKTGYWRASVYDEVIYTCEPVSDSCLGGENSECAEGYRGVLCQSCMVSDKIYSKSFGDTCVQCSDDKFSIIARIFFGGVFLIIFYIYIIHSNISLIDTLNIDEKTGEISRECKENFYSPIFNKILMNYFQIVSLIKGINLGWGTTLGNLFAFQYVAGNAPSYLYNFDCLITKDSPIPALYLKIIMTSLTPIIAMILLGLFWYIMFKRNKDKIDSINCKFTTSQLVLLNILQPTIVNTMFTIVSCKNVNGINYVSNDLYFECYDDNNVYYIIVFALPSMIIWIILYPLYNLYRLIKTKQYLTKLHVRQKFGFLYNSYRIKRYWWEFFEIYKKYILILIINFVQISVETKSLIILLILGFCSYFLFTQKPYLTSDVNRAAFLSDIVAVSTIFFGLLSFSAKDDIILTFGNIVIMIMNIIFLFYFAFKLLIVYKNKVRKLITKMPFLTNPLIRCFDKLSQNYTFFSRVSRKGTKTLNAKKQIIIIKS